MPSISELEAFFSERQGNKVHYLCNLHKEADNWQYDDLLGRRE